MYWIMSISVRNGKFIIFVKIYLPTEVSNVTVHISENIKQHFVQNLTKQERNETECNTGFLALLILVLDLLYISNVA